MPNEHVEEIGLRFKADGSADYISSLKQINAEMQTTYQEFVRESAEMDKNATATEKLTSKKQMLEKQLSSQEKKVALLRKELQAMEADENADALAVEKKKKELAYAETQMTRYEKSLESVNEELKNHNQLTDLASDALKKAGSTIEGAGQKINGVSQKVIGIGKDIIKTTADFDESMSKVKAISGATEEEFELLRAKAREMGADTKFSASEAADAMTYMAMAGWKTEDMLTGISGIMNLAAASGEDLATTSDIVTDALTAFGQTAERAGDLANIMAAASSNANTNVSLMGETFKYAAAVGGAMGYTMEDMAIAIGLMANSGIKGSQAGTALRSTISRLAAPTDAVSNAMNALGITVKDETTGDIISFREVMEQLRGAFDGGRFSQEEFTARLQELEYALGAGELQMSEYGQKQEELSGKLSNGTITLSEYDAEMEKLDRLLSMGLISDTGSYEIALNNLMQAQYGADAAQKVQYASTIAGKNAMTGLLAIVNASDEDWQKLTSAVDNSGQTFVQTKDGAIIPLSQALEEGKEYIAEYKGEAEKASAVMQNNLNGQLTELDSKLGELKISLGDILMPVVRNAITVVQNVIDKLNSLDEGQKETIVQIGLVVAAAGPLLIIVGKVITTLGTLIGVVPKIISGFGSVTSAFNGFVGLIGAHPIVAAITALILILATLYAKCEWFRDGVNSIFGHVKDIFSGLIDFVTGIFTGDWEKAWDGVVKIFGGLFGGLKELVKLPFNGVISLINKAIDGINSISIDIPDFVPLIGGQHLGFNLGHIPLLAKGGNLLAGAAVVAEAGPELLTQHGTRTTVTPLTRGAGTSAAVALDDATVARLASAFAAAVSQIELGVSIGERDFARAVHKVV